jgi:hypothetical protein
VRDSNEMRRLKYSAYRIGCGYQMVVFRIIIIILLLLLTLFLTFSILPQMYSSDRSSGELYSACEKAPSFREISCAGTGGRGRTE